MVLSIDTSTGYLYTIEGTDDLVFGAWANIVTDMEGINGLVTITNSISGDTLFFRGYLQDEYI